MKNKSVFTVWLIIIVALLSWVWALTVSYFSFGYFDWDLAFFNQAMWNSLHGSLFSSLFNINFLGNHANFVAFLFLPLYFLFPHALFLIYLKVIVFCFSALPIFLIAREKINARWGVLFVAFYFLYSPFNYALIYEFDWENLAIFLIPFAFYFYLLKNFKYFVLTALLILITKENLSLIICAFGFYALLQRRGWRWHWFCFVSGGLWFYWSVFLIIPHYSSIAHHGYWGHYSILKTSLIGILGSLFHPNNRDFLFQLFAPLGLIPFLGLDILLLGSPIFLQHMLSKTIMEHTIVRNYASTLVPFIFIAEIFGASLLIKIANRRKLKYPSFIVVFCICISIIRPAIAFFYDFSKYLHYFQKNNSFNAKRWALLSSIPKEASVIASRIFLAELSTRKQLYAFSDIYAPVHYRSHQEIPAMEYALVDFNAKDIVIYILNRPTTLKLIGDFFRDNNLGVRKAINDTVLFKNNYISDFRLFEEKTDMDLKGKKNVLLDKKIRLFIDILSINVSQGQVITLTFYWQCLNRVSENYGIQLFLVDRQGRRTYNIIHPIGYWIKPTSGWKRGVFIKEHYNFLIPDLPIGEYLLRGRVFDFQTGKIALLIPDSDIAVSKENIFDLGVIYIRHHK